MISSRGMGDINPSKRPGAKKKQCRDDTGFINYAAGGKVGMKRKRVAKGWRSGIK